MEAKVLGGLAEERDKNTNFFHKIANARHIRILIGRIRINGEWVIENSNIPTKIVHYSKLLLSKLVGGVETEYKWPTSQFVKQ